VSRAVLDAPPVKIIYHSTTIHGRGEDDMTDAHATPGKQMIDGLRPGDKIDSYFSVAYKKPVSEYKYGYMFEFRAADRTGHITAKFWGGGDRGSVDLLHKSFDRGDVVRVRGEAGEYRGQVEISLSEKNGGSVEKAAEGSYEISALVETLDGIDTMKERLLEVVGQIEEPHMRRLLEDTFSDEAFMQEFSHSPASITLHSSVIGGLIHHTLNVVELCAAALRLQPSLDRDLVMAGALLHDIGKAGSFTVTTNINHTVEGNLVGHINLGDQELVGRIASVEDFPSDLASKLRHIVVSHHGRKEWGSPVEPMMPEALLVHMADDFDAKLEYMTSRRRDALTEDDWTWDKRLSRLIYLK
jgi:3'-5' exoribonuclease